MKTQTFSTIVDKLLKDNEIAKEYNRISPFYNLADQIILLRKKREITQEQLAEKAKTTQAVISRVENASVHCSLETVIKLAEALDALVEINLRPVEETVDSDKDLDLVEIDGQRIEKKFSITRNLCLGNQWDVYSDVLPYHPISRDMDRKRHHKIIKDGFLRKLEYV